MCTVVAKVCVKCGVDIPIERLECLPDTTTCVTCSTVKAKIGFLVFDHKTGGTPIFVDPDDTETLRVAKRANRRAR